MPDLAPVSTSYPTRYSNVAITLHWLIGILLLFEVGLGLRMVAAHGAQRFAAFQLHKSIGITLLLLVVLRLVWRWRNTPPPLVHSGWERALAHGVHLLFYALLFALPLSGWLIVSSSRIMLPTLLYATIPWPHLPGFETMSPATRDIWNGAGKFVHNNGLYVAYGLFALHLAGVIKHQFVDRDADLARMAPGVAPGVWRDWRVMAILLGSVVAIGLGLQWLPIGGSARTSMHSSRDVALVPAAEPARKAPNAVSVRPATDESNASDVAGNTSDAATVTSPDWRIAAGSTLRFATNWSGDAINGSFGRFDGDIRFDPYHLDTARVEIRIPVASAATGDVQRDETMKSADWFAAASFGNAIFNANRFRKVGDDRYIATGTLTIKA